MKDLCSLEVQGQRVVVTASNDGFIKVWQFEPDMVSFSPLWVGPSPASARVKVAACTPAHSLTRVRELGLQSQGHAIGWVQIPVGAAEEAGLGP